ncbi:MAG: hypothetical protein ACTSQY_11375 [Candidatus Odinarchaeia archaeon]
MNLLELVETFEKLPTNVLDLISVGLKTVDYESTTYDSVLNDTLKNMIEDILTIRRKKYDR